MLAMACISSPFQASRLCPRFCCHRQSSTLNVRPTSTLARPLSIQSMKCNRSNQERRFHICIKAAGDTSRSLKETVALDELIDKLIDAKSQQQLAQIVAENFLAFDDKSFWLRVAMRSDTAASQTEKEKLKEAADSAFLIVQEMVKRTGQQLSDSGKILQEILASAADERGEWYIPLTATQVQAIRDALQRRSDYLDEALLSNAFAYLKKCSEDGFDGMVELLQKVLQLYAAKVLRGPETTGVEGALNEVLYAEEKDWGPLIRKYAEDGTVSEITFMATIQKKMETTVLGLQSGTYAQRVQAEYLKEIEGRAKSVFRELAAKKS